ncbi:hypothetical protein ACWNYO_00365 [Candidatus Vidania fulgoroideorum]
MNCKKEIDFFINLISNIFRNVIYISKDKIKRFRNYKMFKKTFVYKIKNKFSLHNKFYVFDTKPKTKIRKFCYFTFIFSNNSLNINIFKFMFNKKILNFKLGLKYLKYDNYFNIINYSLNYFNYFSNIIIDYKYKNIIKHYIKSKFLYIKYYIFSPYLFFALKFI